MTDLHMSLREAIDAKYGVGHTKKCADEWFALPSVFAPLCRNQKKPISKNAAKRKRKRKAAI